MWPFGLVYVQAWNEMATKSTLEVCAMEAMV